VQRKSHLHKPIETPSHSFKVKLDKITDDYNKKINDLKGIILKIHHHKKLIASRSRVCREVLSNLDGDSARKSALLKISACGSDSKSRKDIDYLNSNYSPEKDKSFFKDDSDRDDQNLEIPKLTKLYKGNSEENMKEGSIELDNKEKPPANLESQQYDDSIGSPFSNSGEDPFALLIQPLENKLKLLEDKLQTLQKVVSSNNKKPSPHHSKEKLSSANESFLEFKRFHEGKKRYRPIRIGSAGNNTVQKSDSNELSMNRSKNVFTPNDTILSGDKYAGI
jgi:hypothetical protein